MNLINQENYQEILRRCLEKGAVTGNGNVSSSVDGGIIQQDESEIFSLQALRDKLEEKGKEIEENRKELEEEKAYFEEGKEAFVDAVWRAVRSEFQAEVLSLNLQLKELRKYSSVEFPPEFAKKEEALREAEKTLREDIRKQAKKWQEILAREQEVKEKEKKLEDIIEKRVREEMLQIVKGVDK